MGWIPLPTGKRLVGILLAISLLPACGCVGILAQGLYMLQGNTIPAAFEGLQGKRVAVVCVSSSSALGPDSVAEMLARSVGSLLRQNVKNIDVVHHDEIADWIDNNGWNEVDYRQIGRGVKAEMVVAIDLDAFRLHEGQTLFKGRATATTTVYDMGEKGKVIYRAAAHEYVFPENGALHTTETNEASFRRVFVGVLSQYVARQFYAYELKEDFAREAESMFQR